MFICFVNFKKIFVVEFFIVEFIIGFLVYGVGVFWSRFWRSLIRDGLGCCSCNRIMVRRSWEWLRYYGWCRNL